MTGAIATLGRIVHRVARHRLVRRVVGNPLVRSYGPYLLLSAGLFLCAAVVGAAAGLESGTGRGVPIRDRGTAVRERTTWWFVAHNGAIGLRMAGGVLLGGLPTLYLLLFNGGVVGATAADAAQHLGTPRALALFLPHGVVELPAIWLFGALGFRWLHAVWLVAGGRSDGRLLPSLVLETVGGLTLGFGLLTVAGFVEAEVTVPLARAITAVHAPVTG